ncbi:hypothetical protein Patl1_20078 [Pistacia atlantica]|uniref:Uncharacterized protein n=1 Tax=Pistacia atlantica TaxID=434234 RepID=A0ACC1BLN4_9ROSI|nr:hypothetical protein Patl1_20078 [Pistacia atlantica]
MALSFPSVLEVNLWLSAPPRLLQLPYLRPTTGNSQAGTCHVSHSHESLSTIGTQLPWTFECTEEWKNFRALMKNELFGSKIVDSQFHIREKKIGELVEFLGSKEGQKVQIREVLFITTFNSLSNIYLSKDFPAFGSGESRGMSGLVRDMMELWTAPNISDLFPILSGLDLQGLRKKANECVKKMCGIWDSTIKERRERRGGDHQSNHRDFLDALLDSGFSDEQISLIFVELLAAVSDSTTSTVEWALAELLKKPEAMNKIREELAQGVY